MLVAWLRLHCGKRPIAELRLPSHMRGNSISGFECRVPGRSARVRTENVGHVCASTGSIMAEGGKLSECGWLLSLRGRASFAPSD
jgi:hypothetical protein